MSTDFGAMPDRACFPEHPWTFVYKDNRAVANSQARIRQGSYQVILMAYITPKVDANAIQKKYATSRTMLEDPIL